MKKYFLVVLMFSLHVKTAICQSWIPSQRPSITDENYKNYTIMLKDAFRKIKQNTYSQCDIHNIYVCYEHLKAPKDTTFKYMNAALDSNITYECDNLFFGAFKNNTDKMFAKYGSVWDSICERCENLYASYDSSLIEQLAIIKKDDQIYRNELEGMGEAQFDKKNIGAQKLWALQNSLDSLNQVKIEAIIAQKGYPGRNMVGTPYEETAFYVIQHSNENMMLKYLPMLEKASKEKQVDAELWALLLDRCNMTQGIKQVYGTQLVFNKETQKLELYQVENMKEVDIRRKSIGMVPLRDYLKEFGVETIKETSGTKN
jgi:hypothetical protein